MPYSGRVGRVPGTREIVVASTPYVIAYRIVEKTIHVLAVLHGAQDWPQTF
jgi:toxin ParE1/3/4